MLKAFVSVVPFTIEVSLFSHDCVAGTLSTQRWVLTGLSALLLVPSLYRLAGKFMVPADEEVAAAD